MKFDPSFFYSLKDWLVATVKTFFQNLKDERWSNKRHLISGMLLGQRLKVKKMSVFLSNSFFVDIVFLMIHFCGAFQTSFGRGSERRRSERRQAKNFRTLKWSF
jgi:hypothetical protein